MNEKVLHIVEFNKIIAQLAEHANSEPAKALCRDLRPMDNLPDIRLAQEETDAALQLLLRKGNVNFGSNRDFGYTFGALSIGSTLTAAELLHLASFLDNVGRVQVYGTTEDGGKGISALGGNGEAVKPEDNILFDLFDCLYPLKSLSREIQRCILSEEDIADEASPGLRRVRREIGMASGRIHQQLSKLVNVTLAPYLQDSIITMRGNRYCIPIKSEYKNQVQGIIHDQSASGSTLFIEPAAIVSLNNQIRELTLQEKEEIEKVLATLSGEAADNLMALKDNAANMTKLDFIFAKAKLALEQNATMPSLNNRGHIKINRGRHPLIDKKKVVPIDLELGEEYDLIVITGPNTGGKTVTLKTVGLFELMGMAGLHIPAGDHSELSLFGDVFADIGDEQSIEQNLSTFSSHMTTIVDILGQVRGDCLCLFDELGAGTDPTEGAALAISILNYLHERGIRAMATTHYSELKVYAMNTPGVINASCEFNVETLQPTYKLLIGVPGKSNAFVQRLRDLQETRLVRGDHRGCARAAEPGDPAYGGHPGGPRGKTDQNTERTGRDLRPPRIHLQRAEAAQEQGTASGGPPPEDPRKGQRRGPRHPGGRQEDGRRRDLRAQEDRTRRRHGFHGEDKERPARTGLQKE